MIEDPDPLADVHFEPIEAVHIPEGSKGWNLCIKVALENITAKNPAVSTTGT